MRIVFLWISTLLVVTTVTTSQAQFVYFSDGARSCGYPNSLPYAPVHTITVHAPEASDLEAVSFRLESTVFGPAHIASIVPGDGVTIESGDLFSGMRVSVPCGPLEHVEVLTLNMDYSEPTGPVEWDPWAAVPAAIAWTRDVTLHRTSGDQPLPDVAFEPSHCEQSGTGFDWVHPDTVEVPPGASCVVDVRVLATPLSSSWSVTELEIVDELNWYTECTGADGNCIVIQYCPACPWHWQTLSIHFTVPLLTPGETFDTVEIAPINDWRNAWPTTFVIKTASPLPTKPTSWGGIKSKFKR